MTRSRPIRRIVLALILAAAVLTGRAFAQHDTKGKRFWITFMANYGSGSSESDMRLYLASERPTRARVIYHRRRDTVEIVIPAARQAVEVDITMTFGGDVELGDLSTFSMKAIEVIADDEITCYGVNIRSLSADAFLALPDDVLTNRYIVLAYPNAWDGSSWDMSSQFAIVATEDGTTVRIDPSARLNGRVQSTFTITLDRGEVFNGQAATGVRQDVSGTEIRSNKPIALFAGNRRTSIPLRVGNFRDHLVEQMPPLEVWGREAVVTPHVTVADVENDTAVVRVLAAFDGTRWQIDGVEQAPLAAAAPVELPLLDVMHITASQPILVAQYEHSAGWDPGQVTLPGDPFMMLVPPTEQFDTVYVFQSVEYFGIDQSGHFINVVMPTSSIASLRLDDGIVVADWNPTPKPGYSYAQINVAPGAHRIVADAPFGLYAYGFGPAISYGYPGGMLFRTLVHDFEPPDIETVPACLGYDGFAFDSRITDSGIDSLYALPATRNATVTIDPFTPGADTVRYTARLVDPYSDGTISMKAIDSTGRSRVQTNQIPGFTVRAAGTAGNALLRLDTVRLFNGTRECVTVDVENTGIFPQTITGVALDPPVAGVTVETPMPMVIGPGIRVPVRLCVVGLADTIVDVRVRIEGACIGRDAAVLPLVSGVDTLPPTISSLDAACAREVVITISEPSARVGLVTVDTLVNARVVRQTPAGSALPSARVELELAPIDPYRDMIYQVRVADVAGNVRVRRDTIGGFTLAPLDAARDSVSIRFGRDLRVSAMISGASRCDSVVLHNYGSRPLHLSTARFLGNRGYSVPPAQLPIVIAPGADVRLVVCREAEASGSIMHDTLLIGDDCGRSDAVVLRTAVAGLTTLDDCNSVLSVTTIGPAKRNFLATPFPNPVRGSSATVTIGLSATETVTLTLTDASGVEVARLLDGVTIAAGISRIEMLLGEHPAGVYFLRMTTPSGALPAEQVVIQR